MGCRRYRRIRHGQQRQALPRVRREGLCRDGRVPCRLTRAARRRLILLALDRRRRPPHLDQAGVKSGALVLEQAPASNSRVVTIYLLLRPARRKSVPRRRRARPPRHPSVMRAGSHSVSAARTHTARECRSHLDASALTDAAHAHAQDDFGMHRLTIGSRSLPPGGAEALIRSLARQDTDEIRR